MKERPILFQGEMVRAILAGKKTQTRRLIKPQPTEEGRGLIGHVKMCGHFGAHVFGPCMVKLVPSPYCKAGDRLWVREAFAYSVRDPDSHHEGFSEETHDAVYRATQEHEGEWTHYNGDGTQTATKPTWRPGIHMPRWASRITLEVVEIRVQRLNEITETDAAAEGVEPFFKRFPEIGRDQRITSRELARDAEHRASFAVLWDEINGDRALWVSNPWVWAVTFKRIEAP